MRQIFLKKNGETICKQSRPRSDAAFCGVWSGSALFANYPLWVSRLQWVYKIKYKMQGGHTWEFFRQFYKGDIFWDFLFALLHIVTLLKGDLL